MHKVINGRSRTMVCRAQSSQILKKQLISTIRKRNRGLDDAKADQKEIRELCMELASCSKPKGSVNGTWKLLWTTEKETLFIIKYAGIFNTQAGDVLQVIDTTAGRLQNVIQFVGGTGMFLVDSSLREESGTRCSFSFNAASLRLPDDKEIQLPPFGKGWFESIYLDNEIRIASDSRGDLLIVERAGPPLMF